VREPRLHLRPEQWIPPELFAAYCGDDSEPLLRYYHKARAKKKLLVMDLDWLALLLLPAWLGLHRRWAMCATLTACFCGSLLFESLFQVRIPSGAFGGTAIAFGLMARGLLLTDANGLFLKLKKQGASREDVAAARFLRCRIDRWREIKGAFGRGRLAAVGEHLDHDTLLQRFAPGDLKRFTDVRPSKPHGSPRRFRTRTDHCPLGKGM